MHTIASPGSPEKKQQSKDAQKGMRLLAKKLQQFGFERTKPTFFTSPSKLVVEFVHIHKYTFGPFFRIHLGIRLRCDDHPAATLNGPHFDALPTDPMSGMARRFKFEPSVETFTTCADLMEELVATAGEQWFDVMRSVDLLSSPDTSPFRASLVESLRVALDRKEEILTSRQTRDVLNIA